MKRTRLVRKLTVLLGVAVVSIGCLLSPSPASADDHGNHHNNNNWHGNQHHDNGYHYGWHNRSYRRYPVNNYNRTYEYYNGRRGYWDNSSGIRIFINL